MAYWKRFRAPAARGRPLNGPPTAPVAVRQQRRHGGTAALPSLRAECTTSGRARIGWRRIRRLRTGTRGRWAGYQHGRQVHSEPPLSPSAGWPLGRLADITKKMQHLAVSCQEHLWSAAGRHVTRVAGTAVRGSPAAAPATSLSSHTTMSHAEQFFVTAQAAGEPPRMTLRQA